MNKKLLFFTTAILKITTALYGMEASTQPTNTVQLTFADGRKEALPRKLADTSETIADFMKDIVDVTVPLTISHQHFLALKPLMGENVQELKRKLTTYSKKDLETILNVTDSLNIPFIYNAAIEEYAKVLIQPDKLQHYVDNFNHIAAINSNIKAAVARKLTYSATMLDYYRLIAIPSRILKGHTDGIISINWSPDGTRIASASWDGTVRIWDVHSSTCLHTLIDHTDWFRSATWSPDGKHLASASRNGTVRIWNVHTGTCLHTLIGHTDLVLTAKWSPDGTQIASASYDETVRIWDAHTGTCLRILTGHTDIVMNASWSPDSKHLASASCDDTVRIWNVHTSTCLHTLIGHNNTVTNVSWSRDGKHLASASWNDTVRIWDAHTGACIKTLCGHTRRVNCVTWSPDGTQIASAAGDKTVRIWDAHTGTCLHIFTGHTYIVTSVHWSPDGTHIASASWDRTVRIWDIKPLLTLIKGISLDQILGLHAISKDSSALKNPHVKEAFDSLSPELQKAARPSHFAHLTTWQKVGIGLGAAATARALGYVA